jgi:hypothetical protein
VAVRGTYATVGIAIMTFAKNILCGIVHIQQNLGLICVETVARGGNCLFQSFCSFLAFEIIQNNAWLHIDIKEDYKMYMEIKLSVWW